MSEQSRQRIPDENEDSFVNAPTSETETEQAPLNPSPSNNQNDYAKELRKDLQSYEKHRRCLFTIAFGFTLAFITILYGALCYWIYTQAQGYHIHSNMWHIAVILALPPTTLLFLLLKVLAKNQTVKSTSDYPASELISQVINILRDFLNKK